MEEYSEQIMIGHLSVEISVRKKFNQDESDYCVQCIARNNEGRLVWETPVTHNNGVPKTYDTIEEAVQDAHLILKRSEQEEELTQLAYKPLDEMMYFLVLI